ncbi:S8 family serine peptidase [bacterium]|nr:S8 family serine peptidase [bacterium]
MEIVNEFQLDQYYEIDSEGHLLRPRIDSAGIPPIKGLRKYHRAIEEMNPPPDDAYVPGLISIKFNPMPPGYIFTPDWNEKDIKKISNQFKGKITGCDDVDEALQKHKALSIKRSITALSPEEEDPIGISRWFTVEVPEDTDLKGMKGLLEKSPNIECVSRVGKVYPQSFPQDPPNDPEYIYGRQWGLNKINSPLAWNFTLGSPNVVVAVLGGGVHWHHEDLINSIYRYPGSLPNGVAPGCDLANKDDNPEPEPWGGPAWQEFINNHPELPLDLVEWEACHETHIAGIIAAQTNNGLGMASVCPGCKILPVKCWKTIDDSNTYKLGLGIVYAAWDAVDWGIPVKVINISCGDKFDDDFLHDMILFAAYYRGIGVVAAAGNQEPGEDYPYNLCYPAAYPEVMAVGASNQYDQRASFSCYYDNGYVDVVAPGVNIQSTVEQSVMGVLYNGINESDPNPPDPPFPNGMSYYGIGTSFAAPHAAAVVAQLVSYAVERGQDWFNAHPHAFNCVLFGAKDIYGYNEEVGEEWGVVGQEWGVIGQEWKIVDYRWGIIGYRTVCSGWWWYRRCWQEPVYGWIPVYGWVDVYGWIPVYGWVPVYEPVPVGPDRFTGRGRIDAYGAFMQIPILYPLQPPWW